MARVDYSPQADRDLHEIWSNIADDNRPAADRLIRSFDDVFRMLADHPHAGRSRNELQPGLRSHPVRNHLLFYRPQANGIEVVRVVHGARDLDALFDDTSAQD